MEKFKITEEKQRNNRKRKHKRKEIWRKLEEINWNE